MLDVRVLGPLTVHVDGRKIPLRGPRQRALLARFTAARGRPLRPELLIADLWDEKGPRDPAHALQAHVSRLRAALPVEIEFVDDGYRVDASTFQSDDAQFERLFEQSDRFLADGDLHRAAESLRSALALWHGDAFAGLHSMTALQIESVRLAKLRAAAIADRIDVDLALGRSRALVPELHALVVEQPLLERHWGQLMTALHGSGSSNSALDVFTRAREVFVERLGVEPSGELCGLHMQILRDEPPEALLRLPALRPGPVEAVRPGDVSSPASEGPLTSNRPGGLLSLLRGRRSILLTGPAGIGKTHLLRTISAAFEARHQLAPLLSASPAGRSISLGVFAGIAGSVPTHRLSPAALIDLFTRQRSKTVLLVDDVDQLDEASLFVVTHLIRTAELPAVLTVGELHRAPHEIVALYDGGDLNHEEVGGLTDTDVDELAAHLLGGPLTPDSRTRIIDVARRNPLHLREIIIGSLHEGRLVETERGWELRGAPAPTPRLARLVGERFDGLSTAALEAAASVAIAGEFPADGLENADRRALARADLVEFTEHGWLRLSHPLDAEVLRSRCSDVLWHELTRDVVRVLRDGAGARAPEARRRAHVLALDLNGGSSHVSGM